jgi:hypothetical protein
VTTFSRRSSASISRSRRSPKHSLGCPDGRKWDPQLRRSITNDLYEWIERREFSEEDVLMLDGGSKLCVPFPELDPDRETGGAVF